VERGREEELWGLYTSGKERERFVLGFGIGGVIGRASTPTTQCVRPSPKQQVPITVGRCLISSIAIRIEFNLRTVCVDRRRSFQCNFISTSAGNVSRSFSKERCTSEAKTDNISPERCSLRNDFLNVQMLTYTPILVFFLL
jgi:hypothetical protein